MQQANSTLEEKGLQARIESLEQEVARQLAEKAALHKEAQLAWSWKTDLEQRLRAEVDEKLRLQAALAGSYANQAGDLPVVEGIVVDEQAHAPCADSAAANFPPARTDGSTQTECVKLDAGTGPLQNLAEMRSPAGKDTLTQTQCVKFDAGTDPLQNLAEMRSPAGKDTPTQTHHCANGTPAAAAAPPQCLPPGAAAGGSAEKKRYEKKLLAKELEMANKIASVRRAANAEKAALHGRVAALSDRLRAHEEAPAQLTGA
ncbi:hypothetical protein DIPPA_15386 [Diplonema papillatum]|nr:hypothetical protein DIPPA_15386 [Diplonema papillatum]